MKREFSLGVRPEWERDDVMNLDEAIEHAMNVYVECPKEDCNQEHLQLAKWLIELKRLREVVDKDTKDIRKRRMS